MSDEKPDTDQGVRDAIAAWIAAADDERVIVLNYHVVAEVIGPDSGEPWLKVLGNRALSPWARVGLATAGMQTAEADLRDGWEGSE